MRVAVEMDETQRQILAAAGISAEDVDLVVQARVRREHDRAREDVEILRAAENALARHADAGLDVPESDRWGKGAKVAETDLLGARRTLAAAIASADALANAEDTPEQVEPVRRSTISGMCRREAEGKHGDNLRLIDGARPRRGGRIGAWM